MNRQPPELDARLAAWLDEGPSRGPEEVLTRALARARSTGQDRAWHHPIPLPSRFQTMSPAIPVAAAAVLALAVGVTILPRAPEAAAPAPSESPSPAAAAPTPLRQGPLPPGDYTVAPFAGAEWAPCGPSETSCPEASVDDDLRFTFTLPDGWAGAPFGNDIWLSGANNSGPEGAGLLIGRGGWLYSDPCADSGEADIPVGPTVDDFVDALANHQTLDLSEPVDASVGGYPATYTTLQGPADRTDCQYFQAWAPSFYAQGDSNLQHVWVVDVDGVRVVIHGSEFPDTDPERSAELRAIVESMRIERDSALAPSPSPETVDPEAVIHGWPSTDADGDPGGLYSWIPGFRSWMHKVVPGSGPVEVTFHELEDGAYAVSDLGNLGFSLDGPYGESPEPLEDARLQSWIMSVDGSQVVFLVKSYRDTTPATLAEAVAVIESIRAEPTGTGAGYRLVFELEEGWDSG